MLGDPAGPDPLILMLRQYRYAAGSTLWEIPAGVLQPGEDPLAGARRELEEETGAHAERMEHLTTVYTTPGFTDEQIHLFWATGLTVGEPNHEPDEFIELRTENLSSVMGMIRSGEIADAKSIVALLYVAGFRLNM
jgi:ADP-ribose pyrophosphatase